LRLADSLEIVRSPSLRHRGGLRGSAATLNQESAVRLYQLILSETRWRTVVLPLSLARDGGRRASRHGSVLMYIAASAHEQKDTCSVFLGCTIASSSLLSRGHDWDAPPPTSASTYDVCLLLGLHAFKTSTIQRSCSGGASGHHVLFLRASWVCSLRELRRDFP